MRVAISAGGVVAAAAVQLSRQPFDALGQPRDLDRLEQVVDGRGLEGIERIGIVGSDEDDERRMLLQAQLARGLESVELRHAHIEKCHVGREFLGELQCFGAIGGNARRSGPRANVRSIAGASTRASRGSSSAMM